MELLLKYFPELNRKQIGQFEKLLGIIPELNSRVNVISRKDMGNLEERHILHSLSIAKKFYFDERTRVVDVGTGGGFPGIPLAVMFPDTRFTLLDSISKKIRLVNEIIAQLGLLNTSAVHERMENFHEPADFIVSRAVTAFPQLSHWTHKLIEPGQKNNLPNGLISLKGGDLRLELKPLAGKVEVFSITDLFEEPFFYTKKIVYLKK